MPNVVRFAKQIKLRKDIVSGLRHFLPCLSVYRVQTFSVLLHKRRMRVAKYVERMGGRRGKKAPLLTTKRNVKLPLGYVKYERLCWIQLA